MLKDEVAREMQKRLQGLPAGRLLELGTGWGQSASFFGKLLPAWNIYTVDSYGLYGDGRIYDKWDAEKVKRVVDSLPPNVIQILGNSQNLRWELPLDFLFIDADHTYAGCKADFMRYESFVRQGGYVCFDDYTQENNPANGVAAVVQNILSGPGWDIDYEGYYCAILKKL